MKRMLSALAFCFLVMPLAVLAQGRPYTDGPVTQVVGIKIKAGNFDKYMSYIASTWKKEQEALKAAGVIVDYGVYAGTPRSPHDADVYLTTTYENMAALDGLDDRSDPVIAKALAEQSVSVEQLVQQGRGGTGASVPVVIITHQCREGSVLKAFDEVRKHKFMSVPPRLIRIEDQVSLQQLAQPEDAKILFEVPHVHRESAGGHVHPRLDVARAELGRGEHAMVGQDRDLAAQALERARRARVQRRRAAPREVLRPL